jgi:predicted  nucleic acid-binding Zn-ribbon protein
MIKISNIIVSEIDSQGDFELMFSDCYSCGCQQYTYLNEEEAHSLMFFLKKQLAKHEDLLTIKNK